MSESHERKDYVLRRLRDADGPKYDELVKEMVAKYQTSSKSRWPTARRVVRAIRQLLWEGYITTESDESIWLTGKGWDTEKYVG